MSDVVFTIEIRRVGGVLRVGGWVATLEHDALDDPLEGIGPTPDDAVGNLADELVAAGVLDEAVKAGDL